MPLSPAASWALMSITIIPVIVVALIAYRAGYTEGLRARQYEHKTKEVIK